MNFKDFCNTSESSKNTKDNHQTSTESKNFIGEKENTVEEVYDKYKNFNKDELLEEFLKESSKAKQSGLFNNEKIEELKQTLFPYLNKEQQEYFYKLMGMVKND